MSWEQDTSADTLLAERPKNLQIGQNIEDRMRVYHFTKLEYGKKIIQDRRLKISLIDSLNDPYELRAIDLMDKERREMVLNTKNFLAKEVGVICFSKNWNIPIMWSHYADRHRGVCLGFDVEDSLLTKIDYRMNPYKPYSNRTASGNATEIVKKMLKIKHKPWSYEEEYRLFSPIEHRTRGVYYKEFDYHLNLREVYFGVECDDIAINEVKASIERQYSRVDSFRTRLDDSAFKIVEDGIA